MIIEDHDRRDDRKQPADGVLAPGITVQGAVLGEIGYLIAPRYRRVTALVDELPRGRAGLIGVDLVRDEEHYVGPAFARHTGQSESAGGHRVRPVFGVEPGAPPPALDGGQF